MDTNEDAVPDWLHRTYMRAIEHKWYSGTEMEFAKLQYMIFRLGNKTDKEPPSFRQWIRGDWR